MARSDVDERPLKEKMQFEAPRAPRRRRRQRQQGVGRSATGIQCKVATISDDTDEVTEVASASSVDMVMGDVNVTVPDLGTEEYAKLLASLDAAWQSMSESIGN